MVFISTIIAFLTVTAVNSLEVNEFTKLIYQDFILCRNCGADIASPQFLIPKLSPKSWFAFNESLFLRDEVLVQVLDIEEVGGLAIITSLEAGCDLVGQWTESYTFFPGYEWKLCMCPYCGDFIGWLFRPINPRQKDPPFYTIILTAIVAESFANSFLTYPAINQDQVIETLD